MVSFLECLQFLFPRLQVFGVINFGINILVSSIKLMLDSLIGGSLFNDLFLKLRNSCPETFCERSL